MSRFSLYWSSSTASYLGDGVRFAALPLLAASLSSTPTGVAIVSVAVGLPWLLFGLLVGVIVDRVRRLWLMTLAQLVRAAVVGAVVVAVATGWITTAALVLMVFTLGSCEVLYDIASHAALPAIVDRERLQSANARLITAEVVTFEFAGPAVGGALFAVAAALPFAFDGASFLASGLLLLTVARGLTGAGPADEKAREPGSIRKELLEGFRWFQGHVLIRSLTLLAAAVNLGAGGFYAIFVLFAKHELSIGSAGYGLLIAISAVGSASAGVLAGKVKMGWERRLATVLTAPVVGACFVIMAAKPSVVLTAAAMVAFGFVVTLGNVISVSVRQLVTPDEMLGRIISVHRLLCWGALPVGAALAGLVGNTLGVRSSVAVCGVAVVVGGLLTLRPLLRANAAAYDPERLEVSAY